MPPQNTMPQPPQPSPAELHKDAEAALSAYQELGPDYSGDVVDSFIEQVDRRIAAQQYQMQRQSAEYQRRIYNQRKSDKTRHIWYYIVTLVAAIPLAGIGAGTAGIIGLAVALAGLAVIAGLAFHSIPRNPPELGA
jgi:hypothetical protein